MENPEVNLMERRRMDEARLFELIPSEIWELVLKKIRNPLTLYNLYKATDVFGELLLKRRIEFLFPFVIKHIEPYLLGDPHENVWEEEPCTDCGRRRKMHSEYSNIESIRLVCTYWNYGVEKHAEELLRRDLRGFYCENFQLEPSKSRDFLQHFAQTHRSLLGIGIKNPFLGRTVTLKLTPLAMAHEFQEDVIAALTQYGKFVYNTSLVFRYFSDELSRYSSLQNVLSCMPNLKSLRLVSFSNTITLDETRELERNIAAVPLVRLQQLKQLGLGSVSEKISKEIFEKCSESLKSFLLIRSETSGQILDMSHCLTRLQECPNLNCLEIERITNREIKVLCDLGNEGNLHLANLGISFENHYNYSLNKQLKLFENWKNYLTSVTISFSPFANSMIARTNGFGNRKLNLPNVTYMSLKVGFIACLDFISEMKKLETLNIDLSIDFRNNAYMERMIQVADSQALEIFGFQERLPESNLWKNFASLKCIKYYWRFRVHCDGCKDIHVWPEWIIGEDRYDLTQRRTIICNNNTRTCRRVDLF